MNENVVTLNVFKNQELSAQELINNKLFALVDSMDLRIRELCEELEITKANLARLMLTPHEGGMLPNANEIEKICVQVFHRDDISLNEKKGGRAEWSLKIETWHRGKQQEDIDIALGSAKSRLAILQERKAPELTLDAINAISTCDILVGLIRRKTANAKGRPYVLNQVAFLGGHEHGMAHARLSLLIGERMIKLPPFRTASKGRKGSAIWFTTCFPNP